MSDNKICVLRRCGDLDGPIKCCNTIYKKGIPYYEINENEEMVEIGRLPVAKLLDEMWSVVNCMKCSLYRWEWCVFAEEIFSASARKNYCYPVQVPGKIINTLVLVRFARLCARRAALHARTNIYAIDSAIYSVVYAREARDAKLYRCILDYANDAARSARCAASDSNKMRLLYDEEYEWQRQCLHDLITKLGDDVNE